MNFLVTGSSTGIGYYTAERLARRGFQVFATVRRSSDVDKLKQVSPLIHPIICDVAVKSTIAPAIEELKSKTGGLLHGLVNNAGIALGGPLEFFPVSEIRKVFEVNVFGLLEMTQACIPLLRQAAQQNKRRWPARIVNVSSVSGLVAMPLMGPYSGSKFALEALSDSMRVELRGAGIHVSLVEPGVTATPIWETTLCQAKKIRQALPHEAEPKYGRMLDRFEAFSVYRGPRGAHPNSIARVIERALLSPFPRARYFCGGTQGNIQRVLSLLPKSVNDRFFARAIGTSEG
ncbi:MAG: SDR family oxidoreductase [Xanthomonadaceae bacterium]|nr:SDR family oxidoreductase [Xanthomonadaceae bacterium]